MNSQGVLSAIGVTLMAAVVLLVLHEWRDMPALTDDERALPPALIVHGVQARAFSPEGALQYDLRAESITELDETGQTLVAHPHLSMFNPALAWEVTADEGEISDKGRHVVLRGAVEARDHGPDEILMESGELIYESRLEQLRSPGRVRITHPSGTTEAGAMQADMGEETLYLEQRVESRYDAS
ncbi:LPS export ABC transporter periplasmic protein LptC [Alcanivorax sp. JB21]|uniref:LPS export ABC transporter periplasmic protein LptC n=1 Tax=Alcanivorax limicola TaxID=2874102 RepID=UPI001CBF79C2|nr:LPS export ABC transporter periplasmic protein LptC [Alcanivorax limicola]MBZ2189620.1 LPS export ABC transporter periplasmic protein LptC [Alcanivorax limicola]